MLHLQKFGYLIGVNKRNSREKYEAKTTAVGETQGEQNN